MSKPKNSRKKRGTMTSTLSMTGKSALRLQFVLPSMVGFLSVLAVFNATNHSDSPYVFAATHVLWLLLGAAMLGVTCYPIDEHVRWAPVTGACALAIIYTTVFIPGISATGQLGTIQFGAANGFAIQPAILLSPVYLFWLVRFLPISRHGGDVSWKRFGIYLCQCMLWWLPLMIIPQKELFLAAVLAFALVYWIEGGNGQKALAGVFVPGIVLATLLLAIKWLPGRYHTVQRIKDQWVVSMTFSQVSFFEMPSSFVRAQETLPVGDDNAIFLSMLESIGFVGAGVLLVVMALVGWFAIRRTILAESSVTTTVTIAAWIWISTRSLTYLIALLGWPRGVAVPCPIFNANGNDLIAVMLILSVGLYKRGVQLPAEQSSTVKA